MTVGQIKKIKKVANRRRRTSATRAPGPPRW